jgi:hypothetical protein
MVRAGPTRIGSQDCIDLFRTQLSLQGARVITTIGTGW